jgi:methylmalonyl-CoA/ethylmalonyl-CoA epimerase
MIRDVHHVGIAVRDLERACAFFHDGLGLPVIKEGDAAARGARVVVLGVGRSYLELIAPTSPQSPFEAHLAEHGEGLHHLTFHTDDIDREVANLRDRKVALEDLAPRVGFTGRLCFLAKDAFDGVLLEVVQPSDDLLGVTEVRTTHLLRIDHVVLRVPDVPSVCRRLESHFGLFTKRSFERGSQVFAFLRPGDVILEVIGKKQAAEGRGYLAGLAFEVTGVDALTAGLKEKGYPVGEPHAALQGGRIASVNPTGASGVPVAFIDFEGTSRQARR